MKFDLTVSIVVYKTKPEELQLAVSCVLNSRLKTRLIISDNSPTDHVKNFLPAGCEYRFNNANLGFGAAHNRCIRESLHDSKYHLVLNPDIHFEPNTLESIFNHMECNPDIGLLIPKVINTSGQVQAVCKRLPSPWNLFARRFLPGALKGLLRKQNARYEMTDKNYNRHFDAPSLSGCFMFFRTKCLEQIGFFDEQFFMYMEDIDISRRMHAKYRTSYFPEVTITHGHARESYRINKLFWIHISSAIKYFNKWGWFFDNSRKQINSSV